MKVQYVKVYDVFYNGTLVGTYEESPILSQVVKALKVVCDNPYGVYTKPRLIEKLMPLTTIEDILNE